MLWRLLWLFALAALAAAQGALAQGTKYPDKTVVE
jgi:hypothetical protein